MWNASVDYRIGWYNGSTSEWELVPIAVNVTSRMVTAGVSRFNTFALFSTTETGNGTGENGVVQREIMRPTPIVTRTTFTIISGMLRWVMTSVTSNGPGWDRRDRDGTFPMVEETLIPRRASGKVILGDSGHRWYQ